MDSQPTSHQTADRFDEAVAATLGASAATSESPPPLRHYTAADFERLAHDEPMIFGISEATMWGAVMVGYVLAAGVRLMLATGDQAAGDTRADSRFAVFSTRWLPGFLVLLAGHGLKWPLIPTVGLALLISASLLAARLCLARRHRMRVPLTWRIGLAAAIFWVLALQIWGFVWRWGDHFTGPEFLVLHLSLPVLGLAAALLSGWVRKAV